MALRTAFINLSAGAMCYERRDKFQLPVGDEAYAGALQAVERGVAVFPVAVGTKKPLIGEWEKNASKDPRVVQEWRDANPGCNWGGVPATGGMFAVDLDVKHGNNGIRVFQELAEANGDALNTFTVETTSGGRHHWYLGEAPTRQSMRLGIDVRGGRSDGSSYGYVMLPGS